MEHTVVRLGSNMPSCCLEPVVIVVAVSCRAKQLGPRPCSPATGSCIRTQFDLKGQTDENLNFDGLIYTVRGYSLRL